MRNLSLLAIRLIIAIICLGSSVNAQVKRSVGKEFWLGYISNANYDVSRAQHGGGEEIQNKAELSLIITSNSTQLVPVICTLSFPGTSSAPQIFEVTTLIPKVIKIPATAEVDKMDTLENKGIHITADGDISVYASSALLPHTISAGGAMILPKQILGTQYYADLLGKHNEYCHLPHTTPPLYPEGQQFNQLLVVATEDQTPVRITRIGGLVKDLLMNKGQTYKISDAAKAFSTDKCKPIAVFTGHGYAKVPLVPGFGASCPYTGDFIFDQALPYEFMGTEYYINPLQGIQSYYRIGTIGYSATVSVHDQNGNITTYVIPSEKYLDLLIQQPGIIKSDQPVQVTQYGKSSIGGDLSTKEFDPFQVTVLPKGMGTGKLSFSTLPEAFWKRHVVSVIAPASSVASARLNGTSIASSFMPFGPDPAFACAELPLTQQSTPYTLDMPGEFYAYVYGFAIQNAYGYAAGLQQTTTVNPAEVNFTYETPFCTGKTITFQALPNTEYEPDMYLWNFGNTGTSTQKDPEYSYSTPGTYQVKLLVGYTCGTKVIRDSVIKTIEIVDEAVITAAATADKQVICKNGITQLHASGGTVYHWEPNYNITDVNVPDPYVNPKVDTYYIVTVSDSFCTGQDTDTVFVEVANPPQASFTWSKADHTIYLKAQSSNHIEKWEWDLGDGTITDGEEVDGYTYTSYGTYIVTLKVTNACGTHTFAQEVVIDGTTSAETYLDQEVFSASVFPNPLGEQDLVLETESMRNQPVELVVYDFLGRQQHKQVLEIPGKHAVHRFKKESLFASPGVYYMELRGTSFSSFIKIIIL